MNKFTRIAISASVAVASLGFASQAFAQTAPTGTAATAAPHAVGSALEVHLYDNGKAVLRGVHVTAVNGTNISAATDYGSYAINWTINAANLSQIDRRYGGHTPVSEIQVGDYLGVSGSLDETASSPTVVATYIKDWSLQARYSSFGGTVSAVNASAGSFTLSNANHADITVQTSTSTVFKKGDVAIGFADIHVGDKITRTDGVFDNASNVLQASRVYVYANVGLLNARTFQGTLSAISGTTLPATLTITMGSSTSFTVNVPNNISILNRNWGQSSLANFQTGDTIRIYGAVEPANMTTIDATVVRDATR
ncbi:MAG TPA: DUF5666 domain-containing protein [Candidatus Paceibacterota bacterium]|nr:DUF5666 domain-containing protein [Candidatus Paceibacterota bacterium]